MLNHSLSSNVRAFNRRSSHGGVIFPIDYKVHLS